MLSRGIAGGRARYNAIGPEGMSAMGRLPCGEGKRRGRPTNSEALKRHWALATQFRAAGRPGRPRKGGKSSVITRPSEALT